MNVFDLVGGEETNPIYQNLEIENLDRQYSFLRSLVMASIELKRQVLSLDTIRAFNYHAISCLHATAGELRPCSVNVGDYEPPPHYQVPALLNMFVDDVNRQWERADPVFMATFVLWKLNHIHPFVNGNGRTARAACYYFLCLKYGEWLPGDPILPELIRRDRQEYIDALCVATNTQDLTDLHSLLSRLLDEQANSAERAGEEPPPRRWL